MKFSPHPYRLLALLTILNVCIWPVAQATPLPKLNAANLQPDLEAGRLAELSKEPKAKFLRIRATEDNNATLIEWSVSQNQRIRSFRIERSVAGRPYILIGRVTANGRNGEQTYAYRDTEADNDDEIEYRVTAEQSLSDEEEEEDDEASITVKGPKKKKNTSVKPAPNPVLNVLLLEIRNADPGKYIIQVVDLTGNVAFRQRIQVRSNPDQASISLNKLKPGTYNLQLVNELGAVIATTLIVKQ